MTSHAHETHLKAHAAAAETEAPSAPPAPEPLKVGDVVTLNVEGSPHLTVSNVANNGFDTTCRWWGKDDSLHEHTFHASELTAVPHKKKGK